MNSFPRLQRLPEYVFSITDKLKQQAIASGGDVIDFSMGNPDQPTPNHIVERLQSATQDGANHRYSASKGIYPLRRAISDWYQRRYQVAIDADDEAVICMGSKSGLSHLSLAMLDHGDSVIVPDPCYPIHAYGPILAGAKVYYFSPMSGIDSILQIETIVKTAEIKPKVLFLNYPGNPTTQCVDITFFTKIIALAKQYSFYVIHDLAYADLAFDGYQAPSILQVPGAKDVAVEAFTLSKSYNMPGWRLGFVCGNPQLVAALTKIKSYMDYGTFAPIEHAAIEALTGPQDCLDRIRQCYQQRRDVLCDGLNRIGWSVDKPKATMFVWAKIPEKFREMTSIAFAKLLITQANIAVSPGIGFGDGGEGYVRLALIESNERIQQAVQRLDKLLNDQQQVKQASQVTAL